LPGQVFDLEDRFEVDLEDRCEVDLVDRFEVDLEAGRRENR
jgi:hypothetical protein